MLYILYIFRWYSVYTIHTIHIQVVLCIYYTYYTYLGGTLYILYILYIFRWYSVYTLQIQVVLCANSEPVVNDITFLELNILIKRIAADCPIISQATKDGGLLVMETGQASPCLDLRCSS